MSFVFVLCGNVDSVSSLSIQRCTFMVIRPCSSAFKLNGDSAQIGAVCGMSTYGCLPSCPINVNLAYIGYWGSPALFATNTQHAQFMAARWLNVTSNGHHLQDLLRLSCTVWEALNEISMLSMYFRAGFLTESSSRVPKV